MSETCPICQSQSNVDFKPFCSKRCADVDLGRWLKGIYVIDNGPEGADNV